MTKVDDTSVRGGDTLPLRKVFRYGGHKFRRDYRGDLVQSRKKSDMPCRFYTKTGRCNRALSCPYAHDPGRLSVCPRFLRGSCQHTGDTCALSHLPTAHNTPSCVHFQASSTCRNGQKCLYPHVRVSVDAPVCEEFARDGWCPADPGTCPRLHAWECQEYREKGVCSKDGKCGLRHILRAEQAKVVLETSQDIPGSFEDNTDFVNFDAGSPAPVSDSDAESEALSDLSASDSGASDGEAEEELGVVS